MQQRFLYILTLCLLCIPNLWAQRTLTLEECRRLALDNNKTLAATRANKDVAYYTRKAAETNYMPKVSAVAGYIHTGKEISLLSREQKRTFNTLGTNLAGSAYEKAQAIIQQYPDLAPLLGGASNAITTIGNTLNGIGHDLVKAFDSDNRNILAGSVILTQPLYMGGKIRAYNKITHYLEDVADYKLEAGEQEVLLETDQAYWQLVSLRHKYELAVKYRATLQQLDDDVQKMIREGVATRAQELQVAVRLNEADMLITKVENGMTLSRMLLCQLCGLPLDEDVQAADEKKDEIDVILTDAKADTETALALRPELKQLDRAIDIYDEKVNITRADFLPQLAATGGYMISNPNLYDGFQKKFGGTWSIGLTFKTPIWNWGEGKYKIRAAKAEALMARYQMEDIREKIELQVTQQAFQVNEANKKLIMATKNMDKAEENLRIANLGYKEGVMTMTEVLSAESAWLQAHSEKIDAEVDIMITRASLAKAMGTLTIQK